MHRFWKRLLWVATTLGLGALAYALMRNEGERVLRALPWERGDTEPRPRPVARPAGGPDTAAADLAEVAAPPRCVAVTRSGDRCAREALEGSRYCWQHA